MDFSIRQEQELDYPFVFSLIKDAFSNDPYSDKREQLIVEKLRKSKNYIPELSLVAVFKNEIVGHILLTPINIKNEHSEFISLALAPVSVIPKHQNKGVGSELIRTAHTKAKDLGFESIVVLGHANYYPKFGYKRASQFNITLPFEVPDENCLAIELVKNTLNEKSGIVHYPPAFTE